MIVQDSRYRIGFHCPKYPSYRKTFREACSSNNPCRAFQIYIANSRSYKNPDIHVQDLMEAKSILDRTSKYFCIHGTLIANLAGKVSGPSDSKYIFALNSSIESHIFELDVAAFFNAGVVIHIGSRKDKKEGIKTIIESIVRLCSLEGRDTKKLAKVLNLTTEQYIRRRKVILENSAGEGSTIGSNLGELERIFSGIPKKYRIQVCFCIDTAHAFGAGMVDFRSKKKIRTFLKEFDEKIGLDKLELFHLNDSRVPWNSKKDRHEYLTKGFIFFENQESLEYLLTICRKKNIPCVCEPPAKDKNGEYLDGILEREWETCVRICSNTKYPLERYINV